MNHKHNLTPETPTTGKATAVQLGHLWSLCLRLLVSKLGSPKVSAELLMVSRTFLKDNGYVPTRLHGRVTQKLLAELDSLYRQKLLAGLADGIPSIGLLSEARLYRAELEQHIELSDGMKQLTAVPIKTPFM